MLLWQAGGWPWTGKAQNPLWPGPLRQRLPIPCQGSPRWGTEFHFAPWVGSDGGRREEEEKYRDGGTGCAGQEQQKDRPPPPGLSLNAQTGRLGKRGQRGPWSLPQDQGPRAGRALRTPKDNAREGKGIGSTYSQSKGE